jgi:hypothetical protein
MDAIFLYANLFPFLGAGCLFLAAIGFLVVGSEPNDLQTSAKWSIFWHREQVLFLALQTGSFA